MTRFAAVFLSAAVTGGVFAQLLAEVSLADLLDLLRDVDRTGLAAFAVLSLLGSTARAWRYRLLLAASGHRVRSVPLFLVVLVRNLCADLLPARLGSIVYPYLVTTRLGVPLEGALASFGLAFVFDLLAMAPLLVVVAGAWRGDEGRIALGVALVLLLGAGAVLRFLPSALAGIGTRVAANAGGRRRRVAAAAARLAAELESVSAAGYTVRVLLVSILVRVAKYASLVVFLFALLAPRGYGPAELAPERAFVGVVAAETAASLPISGLAGFGAYEGTWALAFERLGLPRALAQATSISHHLFTQVYGYALGLCALALLFLVRSGRAEPVDEGRAVRESPPRFAVKLAALSLAVGAAARAMPEHSITARGAEPAETRREGQARRGVAAALGGRIVFDSNRGDGFGIYSMAADGSDLRVIADGPQDEVYPDASPDGAWIVFAVAEGSARGARSSVWICRRDGRELRKLADDATFPSFADGGSRVVFERGRRRVFTVGRDGRDERELFRPHDLGFGGREVVKPRLAADGSAVVFTSDRGGRWNAWGVDLRARAAFRVGDGCEPSFFPDGRQIVWVKRAGTRERSGLYRYDRGADSRDVLQDAGAPRGHEYFPSLTPDGRFLLYAAARPGEHSHESANYQIFVKDLVGGGLVRVSRDAFTDRWPRWLAAR